MPKDPYLARGSELQYRRPQNNNWTDSCKNTTSPFHTNTIRVWQFKISPPNPIPHGIQVPQV